MTSKSLGALAAPALVALVLAACTSGESVAPSAAGAKDYLEFTAAGGEGAATDRIVENVRACWFQRGRPVFAGLSYTPESYANHPRILVVPRANPTGRPQLVVFINGSSVKAYGPLLDGAEGAAIAADLAKWSSGATTC